MPHSLASLQLSAGVKISSQNKMSCFFSLPIFQAMPDILCRTHLCRLLYLLLVLETYSLDPNIEYERRVENHLTLNSMPSPVTSCCSLISYSTSCLTLLPRFASENCLLRFTRPFSLSCQWTNALCLIPSQPKSMK